MLAVGLHTITASATDSEGARTDRTTTVTVLANQAPTLAVSTPEDEATLIEGTEVTFAATASDPEDGDLSSSVIWSSDVSGAMGEGAEIQVVLSLGTHVVTATAADQMGASAEVMITVEVVPDQPPSLTVLSPDDGATVDEGLEVSLEAAAVDDADGDLSAQIAWSSDLDGSLGVGTPLLVTLSEGTHTITATVADAGDRLTTATLAVSVVRNQVRVCADGGDGIPTFSTLAEGMAAVAVGGTVRLCEGVHETGDVTVSKAVTITSEEGVEAAMRGLTFIRHEVGNVTISDLTMLPPADGPYSIRAEQTYADVRLERLAFQESAALFGSNSVSSSRVVVQESSFIGAAGLSSHLNISDAPQVDVLDSYFEATAGTSSLQFQRSSGSVQRNRFEECGWRGCIRVINAGTVLIADNDIRTTARREVFEERYGTGVITGLVADGDDVTAVRNVVEGVGPVDPNDRDSFPMSLYGGLSVFLNQGTTTFQDNVVRNAGVGIWANAESVTATDNVFEGVHTGLSLSVGSAEVHRNDFDDYEVSLEVTGPAPAGGATCNWWGDVAGPASPVGVASDVYTPWATEPIAGTGRAC
jgi:hypothetical protein